ncbi:nineteen complex-related protein 2-domain-containing protein [Crucibulum laeve]|uniref:Nineteen complex-related protein 2-domain-containing protein n=1 Tax=Crucibulum laeve TaxID=68775 RepID=A0A5C3M627_9AGAR|nr:nineteen complex-related protein 2-domain-containing protein [Crucibulum laeve]
MASTPPLIFKRTKSKPAQRTRQPSPGDDTGTTQGENADDSPSTLATKLKNKVKRAKPKSRLSFGGDDEEGGGEVFQVKKSNLSRKLALGTHPAVSLNLEQATISPARGPTYDQAYLNQLKASTPTSRPPRPAGGPYDADMSMDVSVDMGDVTMTLPEDTEESSTYIPSESSIQVAKEKRDRLRKTQASGEEDFISLSVAKRSDVSQGPHPNSRLVREEDELGEGDDEFAEYTSAQERIALGKKSRKIEASKRRDNMKELIADAEEEDEETMEWEQEQLRRGGHRTPEPTSAQKVKQVYKPAPIPPATPVPTLAPAISRLTQQLTQLTTSHASNTAALHSLSQERAEVDDREKEMRDMVERAEAKRAWFDSFKEWVEGVAGFLDEKYPLLEKLEEEHISLLQERFDLISQRRHLDDEDDLSTFLGPLPIPTATKEEQEEIDELGRVIPKPNPATERRERRVARLARRQNRLQQRTKAEDEEGYSTDSSLPPSDASAYSTAIKTLKTKSKEVLADVRAEEFRDPGKGRWSAWREKYADSYVGAWGGLGVVSVWEFWVRLEVVGWDSVEDPRSLDSFKWYKGLYEYSRPGDSSIDAEERELGPDGDLVASMISTAVIPRICKVVEGGAFDAYSDKHVRRMIDLVEEVEASVESGNAKFQMLLKSVASVFQKAIADTETLLTQYRAAQQGIPGFNPEAIPARRRFLARRVKLLKNLLRWRKYAGERGGIGLLIGRLVEGCMLDVADRGWDVGGEEVVRTVAALLPNELVPYDVKRRLGTR